MTEAAASTLSPPIARPASTVVLARPAAGGAEVLLLRRPHHSAFAPGAWVFPGGVVDPGDAVAGVLDPGEPARWAARLGIADPGRAAAYVVAAIREAWEETGILMADAPPPDEALLDARRALLAGTGRMADVVAAAGIRLATRDLLYIAHWITPESRPRRYDTRFFLTRVADEATCELVGGVLEEWSWMQPAEAALRHRTGELAMLPPTVHTLDRLAVFGSLDQAWEQLRDQPVPTILPRPGPGGGWILAEL